MLLSIRIISKRRESREGILKGLIWQTDLARSQHNSNRERATARSLVEESLMLYREMEHREGVAEALCL